MSDSPVVNPDGSINPYALGQLANEVRTLGREMGTVKRLQMGIILAVLADIAVHFMKRGA